MEAGRTLLAILDPEPIYAAARAGVQRMEICNRDVSVRRMACFAKHGTQCALCKIVGNQLRLEQYKDGSVHLNFYAIADDKETLLTVDHVIPVSKKGPNRIDNLQPMCYPCNQLKGDQIIPRVVDAVEF